MTQQATEPQAPRKSARMRAAAMVVHRWVGLFIAVFLTLAGLTGSVLAFHHDLDAALNPELFEAKPPSPGAALLDPIDLRDRVRAQLPASAKLDSVVLKLEPKRSVNYWIDERETFVDPYTGNILGSRKFGDISEGKKNLLTFLYVFHYSLALDDVGMWLFGIVALLWTIDCFVGAYLTFPSPLQRKSATQKRWLSRWWTAWALKTNTLFTLAFTWHRASGLWVWGFLLAFAWSGVALNIGEVVYAPVMNVLFGEAEEHEHEHLPEPRTSPRVSTRAALERGRSLMAAEAEQQGFEILGEQGLFYDDEHGTYMYSVESTLDVDQRLADTSIELDGDDGRRIRFASPTGTLRSTIDTWLIAIHFGAIRPAGIFYRAFVCVFGLMVALLSVTGFWLWLRKRTKRSRRQR